MTVRNVDSKVLLELAGALRQGRNELESRLSTARNRVDSAPGGWNRQPWDGIPSFIRMELEALDRDQRELVERAAKIDVAAAVTELPEALPLSALKFLLSVVSGSGFSFYLAGGAVTGLVAAVSAFTKDFTAKNGKPPVGADFAGLKLNLDNKTAGSSGQLQPARQLLADGTYGSRYTGKVVVNGKTLSDAEIYERAVGIRKAYLAKLGRGPTAVEYDEAMRSGKTVDQIQKQLLAVQSPLSQYKPKGDPAILNTKVRFQDENGVWRTETVAQHIARYGCTMTSWSMLLALKGHPVSQAEIYKSLYESKTGLDWSAEAADGEVELSDLNWDPDAVSGATGGAVRASSGSLTGDLGASLRSSLDRHGAVVVAVTGSGSPMHWVLVTGYDASAGTFTYDDPITGSSVTGAMGTPGAKYQFHSQHTYHFAD